MLGNSNTEHNRVLHGLRQDVRGDGRTLCQHRPMHVVTRCVPQASGSAHVALGGGTEVLAAVSCNVTESTTGGQLHLYVDWVPAVTATYAQALGGSNPRYARLFISHTAATLQSLFGASTFSLEETGTADAVIDNDDGEAEDGAATGTSGEAASDEAAHQCSVLHFPVAQQLSLGQGFAYRLDVDVSILHATGGNLLGAAACAIREALRSVQLPFAVVHETPNGVAVEVDRTKPSTLDVDWSSLPLACVLHTTSEHYIVDPTREEELSLPSRVVVGSAPGSGSFSFAAVQPFPSSRRTAAALRVQDIKTLFTEGLHWCDVMEHEGVIVRSEQR